jgi:uncharacterized protein DUF3108
MKHLLFPVVLTLISIHSLHAQSCASSPVFQQGKQFVFSNTRQGKVSSTTYVIKSVTSQGGNQVAVFSILLDPKADTGAKNFNKSFLASAICNGDGLTYNIKVPMPQGNLTMTQEYPADMKTGDKLKDISLDIPFNKGGKTGNMQMYMLIHRSVEAKESVTTPAGSWMCYKIKSITTVTISGAKMPDGKAIPTNSAESYEWYNAGIGLIKFQWEGITTVLSAIH